MAEYNFVRSDGSIISAEYSQAEIMSDEVIQREITDAFCQYGNNAECLRIDNFPEVYNVKIKDLNLAMPLEKKEFDALVKIRYNMSHKKAHVCICGDCADIEFYEPVNSITTGQACVIYDINDRYLIGSGWICK